MTLHASSVEDEPLAKRKSMGCTGKPVCGCATGGGGGGFAVSTLGALEPAEPFGVPGFAEGSDMPLPAEPLCQVVFRGMKDSEDPQTSDPRYARLIQNAYPVDGELGMRVIGRPGMVQIGSQLGSGGNRRVQGIYQFTKLNGTEYTIAICGGKFYTYSWGGGSWTEDTPSNATISTTATCYFARLADKVIISDGVNKPWTWDGTDDVELTNAPVMYGRLTVYYAKLFGIKNTEKSTIVWSEEADPTIGYEAGGYNNAWTLGQTDQNPLYALVGTNEALYYWRARSIGGIRGAVDTDFKNSGTREGVSTTIGTTSRDGLVVSGNNIFFMDAGNRPHSLLIGPGRLNEDMWADLRETIPDWDETKADKSRSVYDPNTGLVLLGAVADSSSECDRYIAINPRTNEIAGIWQGWTSTAMAIAKDTNGKPTILHGSENGYVYNHGSPQGSTWNDVLNSADGGTSAISHKVVGAPLGSHTYMQKNFSRWDVSMYLETAAALTLSYRTTRGTPSSQSKTASALSYPNEAHLSVGLNGDGRWIEPIIEHSNASERFGLERWCVQAVTYGQEPEIP